MKSTHRAFTLIELLVVIAIIAILAAILFPVFAQAKSAAKKTQALSNIKQVSLGLTMYEGDYDDMIPALQYTEVGRKRRGWEGSDTDAAVLWSEAVLPYVKTGDVILNSGVSGGVFNDPAYPTQKQTNHMGLNTVLSGDDGSATGKPLSAGVISRPADIVIVAFHGQFTNPVWNLPHLPTAVWDLAVQADPTSPIGCSAPTMTAQLKAADRDFPIDGSYTTGAGWPGAGAVASGLSWPYNALPRFRYNGVSNIGLADGHVKGFKLGQLDYARNFYVPGAAAWSPCTGDL